MKFDKIKYPNVAMGHQYALDIVSGKIVSNKYILGACERYLQDLENKDADFYFDPEAAEKYLRLVQRFEHVEGHWPTKNIVYAPWQCWVFMCIMGFYSKITGFRRFRTAHLEVARGNAKALSLNTKIPTPDRGLIDFKDLKIGDKLYSSSGGICSITNRNETHKCKSYRIHFSDKTFVECSDKHLWVTSNKKEREFGLKSVKDTESIFNTQKIGKESNHSVEIAKPVIGSRSDCQLAYVLGYWLGDGHSQSGRFSAHIDQYPEIVSRFKARKLKIIEHSRKGKAVLFTIPALTYWLKEIGVLKNKHIPEKYFMADEDTRRELLRGLMDSDGTCSKQIGNFTFCNTNPNLAFGIRRLLGSLGYKSTIRKTNTTHQNGKSSAYYVTFSTPYSRPSIFGIRAKEDNRSKRRPRYCNKRYITKVEKIEDQMMFCIEVDSPDKTFLITDQYIPTHNSTMASQMLLYFLSLDSPNGNYISTVATKRDQARIVLDSARAMANKNKSFLRKTGTKVLAHTIVHQESNSIARAMSADYGSLDGLKDVLAICDELHAMARKVFEVIYSGMSKRKDSLLMCITTAGDDVDSVGYFQTLFAKKVATGEAKDESFFSAVYTLDDEDDWRDESVWIKANPGLGISVDLDSLRAKVEKAMVTPSDVANIRIKHMNQWISEANAFYDLKSWDKCEDKTLRLENFQRKYCRIGLDLASHIDITSIGYVFKEKDIYYIFDKSFLPEDTVKQKNNPFYDSCIEDGSLIVTKGAAINYKEIQDQIKQSIKDFRVQELLYDPWNATETAQNLSDFIEAVKVPMNTGNLSEPMKKLDTLIREGKVRHNGSKLLRWCIGNVVAKEDHNGNVFPRKSHEKMKIDPVIAILLALVGWLASGEETSVYETRGIRKL
jgi:phage terminase large subunit-like protein